MENKESIISRANKIDYMGNLLVVLNKDNFYSGNIPIRIKFERIHHPEFVIASDEFEKMYDEKVHNWNIHFNQFGDIDAYKYRDSKAEMVSVSSALPSSEKICLGYDL